LANPELGAKQVCPNCQAKFYDLSRRPAHCPKCDTEFDPEEAVKARRGKGRAPFTDETEEDQVKAKPAEADEDEEEEVTAPEIDQGGDAPILTPDDEDDDDTSDDAGLKVSDGDDDDDISDDDDDSVPFIEDEDDDSIDGEITKSAKKDDD
jgi:uncharacterized protein (TIGR02300 family)